MSCGARDGLAVLYVLCDQWLRERQSLAALGVERNDLVAELFAEDAAGDEVAAARRERAAASAALGGDVVEV